MTIDYAVLEKSKLVFLTLLPDDFPDRALEIARNDGEWMMRIVVNEYTEKIKEEPYVVRYPRDWWQAFKDRWFPGWARKRWPVVYHEHIIEARALYPNFRPSLPNQPWSFINGFKHGERDTP